MAKSKRNKVVNLSKISKKNFSDKKVKMVTKIHKFLDEYTYCYAFHHKNMTTLPMAEVRNYWSNSVFLFGKNKVMQVALGKDESDEYKKNSSCLSEYLNSSCGLLFTNEEPEVVIKYFQEFSCPYFGNVGSIATTTVVLKRGLEEQLSEFPPSMESQFKQLGMQVKLDNGKFYLLDDYVVCQEGQPLTPDQSKMTRHLGIKMDEFKIYLKAYLSKDGKMVRLDNEMEV